MLDQESVDIGKEPRLVQGTLFDKAELDRLAAEQRRWEETTLKQSLERMPESTL
jgi:methylmalonyl-CoA mutase N-terminal domain/subunit